MEPLLEAKILIESAENILILDNSDRQESTACALALFYTLKELGKNVNFDTRGINQDLKFLSPGLDHISSMKNFVLSFPNKKADISEINFEKTEQETKIFFSLKDGILKKGDLSFSFSEPKPDLLITIGLLNRELSEIDVLNINNQPEAEKFGKINLIGQNALSEEVFNLIKNVSDSPVPAKASTSLLAGLILSSDNFQKGNTSAGILELAAALIKEGAEREEIIENIYKK